MNDDVILVFNKDVNIITFNWSQILKTLIIPTAILLFQLSVFSWVGMIVILSYMVTTLRVSSCNYWSILLSFKKKKKFLLDKAVLLNILDRWGQRRINSSYARLTLCWIFSLPLSVRKIITETRVRPPWSPYCTSGFVVFQIKLGFMYVVSFQSHFLLFLEKRYSNHWTFFFFFLSKSFHFSHPIEHTEEIRRHIVRGEFLRKWCSGLLGH